MSATENERLSGLRKAAILTALLGPEKAAEAIARGNLDEHSIERLAHEVASLQVVDEGQKASVLQEFYHLASTEEGARGIEAAYNMLCLTLGAKKADEVITRVRQKPPRRPFAGLARMEPEELHSLLRNEPPQIIATVLGHLPRKVAGRLLANLPDETRIDVVIQLASGREPFTEALRQIESALSRKAASLSANERLNEADAGAASGPRAVVETLNQTDLSVETSVLAALAERDPELGEQVRESMFIFEDLPHLEPRSLQLVLRQIEPSDLALALKGSDDELKQVVFDNLSENAAAGLREDLETLGPVRRREVYDAQQKVVLRVRELAGSGDINLRQGDVEVEDMIA